MPAPIPATTAPAEVELTREDPPTKLDVIVAAFDEDVGRFAIGHPLHFLLNAALSIGPTNPRFIRALSAP